MKNVVSEINKTKQNKTSTDETNFKLGTLEDIIIELRNNIKNLPKHQAEK